jgi:hypothetical protein
MESRILEAFASRYPSSSMHKGGSPLRLRSWEDRIPEILSSVEWRLSFLEAMERLEAAGILILRWKRRKLGEELDSAELRDPEALYARLGRETPETLASRLESCARALTVRIGINGKEDAAGAAAGSGPAGLTDSRAMAACIQKLAALPGMNPGILADAARFLQLSRERVEETPLRALSIRLYRDSKRLESVLPFLARAMDESEKERLPGRSYPEASVAGRADLVFDDGTLWPLGGRSLSLSLETVRRIVAIRSRSPLRALSVENKENFHAFAHALERDAPDYADARQPSPAGESGGSPSFIVATGGRPNRAVRAILSLLAAGSWSVRHAGDLDPDGIAILGEVHGICGATPLMMDAATFDAYAAFARPLPPSILRRLAYLDEKVRSLPGIEALARRIGETGLSVEQEIIEYS